MAGCWSRGARTPCARSRTAASASCATTTPGSSKSANGGLLRLLLDAGYTPVVAPLALGTEGERLNVDGDRAAALLAATLGAATLVILSNVPGLLARYPDETSLVRHVAARRNWTRPRRWRRAA